MARRSPHPPVPEVRYDERITAVDRRGIDRIPQVGHRGARGLLVAAERQAHKEYLEREQQARDRRKKKAQAHGRFFRPNTGAPRRDEAGQHKLWEDR